MKKAILIITTLVMAVQLTLFQPIKTQAIGVDTVVKLVGGKAVIRALAEKAGMALSKKQVDNVAGYIQKKTYDGDQKAIDFSNSVNSLVSSGASEKSGFKKYILDPFNWLTGLDLIFGAVAAFQSGYDSSTPVDTFAYCAPSPHPSLNNGKWVYYTTKTSGYKYYFTWSGNAELKVMPTGSLDSVDGTVNVYSKLSTTNNGSTWNTINNQVVSNSSIRVESSTNAPITILSAYNDASICSKVPVLEDLSDTTNVSPVIINNFENDTYNMNTTYQLEIEMPDIINYDDMTSWNEQDPNLENEIAPHDPDAEPTDKPEGSSWWEWLLAPLKAIGDFFKDVGGFLLGILVPSADSVTGIFNGISDSFKAKIPIADQLGNFFAQVENIQTNDTPIAPTFEITMPVEYGGGTFPIIDFTYFDEWRVWVLNFIRFAAWYVFLRRLYNRIPKMVY